MPASCPPQPPSRRRAQSSFEYIVLLAVVLVLALSILGAFGLLPSFSYGAQTGDAARYWAEVASPMRIPDLKQTGSSFTLILHNQAPVSLTVSAANLSTRPSTRYTPTTSLPLTLAPGARTRLVFTTESCTGRQMLAYAINISYSTEQVSGLMERGAKPLYVQCTD